MSMLDDAATLVPGVSHAKPQQHRHSTSSRSQRSSNRPKSRSRSRSRGLFDFIPGLGGASDSKPLHKQKHRLRQKRHDSSSSRSSNSSSSSRGSSRKTYPVRDAAGDHEGRPDKRKHHASSRSTFLAAFGLGRAPSYYKRSPRAGFVRRAAWKLRRLLRDLLYYIKRNPVKVLTLVLLPLMTGGALTALLARFGLRLPLSVERLLRLALRASAAGPMGLVSEAVRMASQSLGARSDANPGLATGHDDYMRWAPSTLDQESSWDDGSDDIWLDGWGDGLKGVGRTFW